MSSCPPHFWRVRAPNGPTATGRCKICGATRSDFRNSLPQRGFWVGKNGKRPLQKGRVKAK